MSAMKPIISHYCYIKNNRIFLDGRLFYAADREENRQDFLKKAFRYTEVKYPNFFKMDDYSKLGMLAAEVLLKSKPILGSQGRRTGIVLSNSQATLNTDLKFQESIGNVNAFFPSPAVFVYTLPNIMAGEIAIRHQFFGENAFFVSSSFDFVWHEFYVNNLLQNKKIENCLTGWVDVENDMMEAFVYLVQNEQDQAQNAILHQADELKKLYNN